MLELIKHLSINEIITWTFFLSMVIFHLFYQLISYRKLLFFTKKENFDQVIPPLPPISVIICAKNEARNLEEFLPAILRQDYPDFQVVVVNDCSDDRTEEVLERLRDQHKNLYFTTIKSDPIYRHGKKLAVTLGIKAAAHEHLIFTDADCYPTSHLWLRSMAQHFSKQKEIVIGVSPYEKSKGLLGQVIGYETLQTAISYTSSALRQKTYMGVGRNMAYTKSLFYNNKGFSGHTHLLSGDDDLFINKAATGDNVAIELSAESAIITIPKTCWKNWYKQKSRHLTTGKFYKKGQKIRFAIEGAQGFLFYASFITLIMMFSYPLFVGGIFILRMLINSTYRMVAAKKLSFDKAYFFQSLWLDILVPILRAIIVFKNTIKPQKITWR